MKPIDYPKAAGAALLLMVLNVAISFPVVGVWRALFEPQTPPQEVALRIAPWSSHLVGPLLFFAAAWLLARRRPERNGLAMAAAVCVFYVLLEAASLAAYPGGPAMLLTLAFGVSMAAKAAAAFAGAALARRRPAQAA
ncbi:hypothetical protein ACFODL_21110 [Phenylobacterium terrae]|uniref:Uncharacterized protein n=1 Tax=Phenylobacterium terrae TaxID=2665495 RepID=A0ABW4MZW0_9CAUL